MQKLAMTQLLTGTFGGSHGYLRLPGSPEEAGCDKEILKLLPELERIRRNQGKELIALRPKIRQMAADKGINIYKDDFDTLPDEIQHYWGCISVKNNLSKYIEHLQACEAQQGSWHSVANFFNRGKKNQRVLQK